VAGGGIGDGFPATKASLSGPRGLVRDGSGNLLIADCANKRVRRVDASSQIMSTVAGTAAPRGVGDGGPATQAALACPSGLAVAGGSLYIADAGADRVRRVDSSGTITTVAGDGSAGFGGDGGSATAAKLSAPSGVALDGAGNLYIADTANHRVRKVDGAGKISTVAGNGAIGVGSDGVPATKAPVTSPTGVAVDPAGKLIIAESGFARIRKVDGSGIISTIAGDGIPGFSGDGGPATSATVNEPTQLVYDPAGNLFFSDRGNLRIRRIEAGTPPPAPVATRKTADCGMTIVKNVTLSYDIGPCPGDGLVIGADGVKLDLNGHTIIGDSGRSGTDVGVRLRGRNRVKVTGGTITGFDAGVAIIGGSGNTASRLTLANNRGNPDAFASIFGDGIVLFFSAGNSIVDNAVLDNGPFDGIGLLGAQSDDNLIQGNRVEGTNNDDNPFGPVGLGIILNPFLGGDRPRELSLHRNRVIDNRVIGNGNGGISGLSNVDGVIQGNRVERNGFQNPDGGEAFPGNGIGVQNLLFAEPKTRVLVKQNKVLGNAADGIRVLSQDNQIVGNTADGNGGEFANLFRFDLNDYNSDPDTFEPNCDSNVWSANIWGSGGFFPACTSAGGHVLGGGGAKATRKAALPPEYRRRPADPPARSKHPTKP
jgi:sugar lactone lactonase YvrE